MEIPSPPTAARQITVRADNDGRADFFNLRRVTMLVRSLGLAAVCAVLLVSPVRAHHSHGNYDTTKWTTMEGKVTELHLLVPHSWLYLEVKDDKGEPTVWAMEATGFGGLFR